MKLYATTTSERASKGQGGEQLHIDIKGEQKKTIFEFEVTIYPDCYEIEGYAIDENSTDQRRSERYFVFRPNKTKGKKKKGEKCECGNYPNTDANNCGKCCEGYKCTYGCGTCFCGCHD